MGGIKPQLYREEHVLTEDDHFYVNKTYKANETVLAENGLGSEAQQACACHSVAEHLLAWLREGKPRGGLNEIDGQPD